MDFSSSYRPLRLNQLRSSNTSDFESPRRTSDTTFGVKASGGMVFAQDFDECMSLNEPGQTHILESFLGFYQRKRGFDRWREVVAMTEKCAVLERVMFTYYKFKFITCFVTWHLSTKEDPSLTVSRDRSISKNRNFEGSAWEFMQEAKAQQFYRQRVLIKSLIQWFGYLKTNYSRKSFQRSKSQSRAVPNKFTVKPRSRSRILAESSSEMNISDLSAFSILDKLNASKPKFNASKTRFNAEVEFNERAEAHFGKRCKAMGFAVWRRFNRLQLKKKSLNRRLRQFRGTYIKRARFEQWRRRAYINAGATRLQPLLVRGQLQRAFIAVRSFAFVTRKRVIESSNISLGGSFSKLSSIEPKSLNLMDDLELQVQIQLLEKKLSALNRELLSEQVLQHNLLLEKKRCKGSAY